MKKKFIVEVDYKPNLKEVSWVSIEMAIHDLLKQYAEVKAIREGFTVEVEEII